MTYTRPRAAYINFIPFLTIIIILFNNFKWLTKNHPSAKNGTDWSETVKQKEKLYNLLCKRQLILTLY